jgi:hypothetical protein
MFTHNLPVGNIPYNPYTQQEELPADFGSVHLDVCEIPNCTIHSFEDEGFADCDSNNI